MSLTVQQYKDLFDIAGTSDTLDDNAITTAIAAAKQALEQAYGRTFSRETNVARTFKARYADHLDVTDLIAVTEIAIDVDADLSYSKTLDVGQYQLEPFNAARYSRISIAPLSTQSFWPGYMTRVTGDWGCVETWGDPATEQEPPAVAEAWRLLTHRLLRRKDAPFGVLGSPEVGVVRIAREDPDVVFLMKPFDLSASGAGWFVA